MGKIKNEIDSVTVKRYGLDAGARVTGIAAADDFGAAPDGFRPVDVLEGCVSVIIMGYPFPRDAIINDTAEYITIRNGVNEKISNIAKDVAKRIRDEGYRTKVITGMGGKWVNKESHGLISLKHAAELAGLGTIGKNYLLTNPEYGNLLWFSAVLTDAYLVPDEKVRLSICDGCDICVTTCPSGALDDPSSFNRKRCSDTMFRIADKKWEIGCYLCRRSCPYRFGVV
ncbi:MAG: hypothetical protein FWG58_04090 [Methanomassiliicoccaceae archaeon]|nr:hypothetical protein [Methanomassiliicoccaceae archaeon]